MNPLDFIRLAIKNLSRQKSRTFLTIVAITVGSLSVILMLSLLISVRQSVLNSLQKLGAFQLVTVTRTPLSNDDPQLITSGNNDPSSDEGKKIDDATVTALKKQPHVLDATPILSVWSKTMHLEGSNKKMWSSVLAYDPSGKVFEIPLLAGRSINSADEAKIVVGWRFVEDNGYAGKVKELIGKHVLLNYESGPGSGPDWGDPPVKPPENAGKEWYENKENGQMEISVEIVGVADNRNMEDSQNYINLAWGKRLMTVVHWEMDDSARKSCEEKFQHEQEIIKTQNKEYNPPPSNCDQLVTQKLMKEDNFIRQGYGSVVLKVDDTKNLDTVAKVVKALGYGATTAKNMVDKINQMFTLITVVLAAIGGISLFVASIGIINTMIMATYERTREIGVMRACGATRGVIRQLFTVEAGLLGFWGGVFGLGLSILLTQLARLALTRFGANLGNLPLDLIGNFPVWLIIGVITGTTLLGMISGLYPAIRASRLNPVEALRYE